MQLHVEQLWKADFDLAMQGPGSHLPLKAPLLSSTAATSNERLNSPRSVRTLSRSGFSGGLSMPRAVGSGQVLCCKHMWGAITSVGAWASPLLGRSPTLPSSIAFASACKKEGRLASSLALGQGSDARTQITHRLAAAAHTSQLQCSRKSVMHVEAGQVWHGTAGCESS